MITEEIHPAFSNGDAKAYKAPNQLMETPYNVLDALPATENNVSLRGGGRET